jgi:hypothetical protein
MIKSSKMRWAGHVVSMREEKCIPKVWLEILKGQTTWRGWEHNIKMDLKEIVWEGVDSSS